MSDSAAPIHDPQSLAVGVVLVFRDISEKQRLEEQLQNAAKLESLGLLAGGIAHDFNNLLAGIFGHIELAPAARAAQRGRRTAGCSRRSRSWSARAA